MTWHFAMNAAYNAASHYTLFVLTANKEITISFTVNMTGLYLCKLNANVLSKQWKNAVDLSKWKNAVDLSKLVIIKNFTC